LICNNLAARLSSLSRSRSALRAGFAFCLASCAIFDAQC
jgi:hypothetical protein